MNHKKFVIRLITIPLFILSSLYALLTANMLTNKSWLMTIDALGGGGWGSLSASQEAWVELIIAVMIVIVSAGTFVVTFRSTTPKPKLSHDMFSVSDDADGA